MNNNKIQGSGNWQERAQNISARLSSHKNTSGCKHPQFSCTSNCVSEGNRAYSGGLYGSCILCYATLLMCMRVLLNTRDLFGRHMLLYAISDRKKSQMNGQQHFQAMG